MAKTEATPTTTIATVCECSGAIADAIRQAADGIENTDDMLDLIALVYRQGWSNGARDMHEMRRGQ